MARIEYFIEKTFERTVSLSVGSKMNEKQIVVLSSSIFFFHSILIAFIHSQYRPMGPVPKLHSDSCRTGE